MFVEQSAPRLGEDGRPAPVLPRSPGAARRPGKRPDLGSASTQPGAHRCLCPPQGPGSSWTAEFRTHGHPATPLLASLLAAARGHKERSRAQPARTSLRATDWGAGRTQHRQTPAGREGPHHCQKHHQRGTSVDASRRGQPGGSGGPTHGPRPRDGRPKGTGSEEAGSVPVPPPDT